MMKKKGSITIFLCFILVSVLMVVSIASESARVGVVQAECKTFTGMAGESVLAGYAKQVFQDYGILLVWENYPVEDQIKENIQANINMADLEGSGTNFLKTYLTEVTSEQKRYVTDNGGEAFVHQVVQYMKYGGFLEEAQKLVQESNKKERDTLEYDTGDSIDIVDNKSKELMDMADEIDDDLESLKDISKIKTEYEQANKTFEVIKEIIQSGKGVEKMKENYFLEKFYKIQNEINKKKGHTTDLLFSMQEYVKKREDFLKETNATSTEKDFVDNNLNIVKNVKGKIDELEGLSVSDISEINEKNVEDISRALTCMKGIMDELELLSNRGGIKEDENTSLYKKAKALIKDGVLSLVIEDVSKVSNNTVSDSGLPSKNQKKSNQKMLKNLEDKALMAIYDGIRFGNYVEEKEDTSLKYELEYIINGSDNDKNNLLGVAGRLIAFRNITNAAYLLTDKAKMSEINSVASAAALAFQMPFLEPIITAVLVEAWALIEAASDVTILLDGGKVPLIKSGGDWNTDLWSMESQGEGGDSGLSYLEYCQLLILTENSQNVIYRTMDIIQLNIQKRYQSAFRMDQCVSEVDFKVMYSIKPMFLAPSWSIALLGADKQEYQYECSYKNSY